MSSDAILLESNGHFAMIDGGSYLANDDKIILNYLNNLNVKRLDFFLLTHAHGDHIGSAAKIINNFDIGRVYTKEYLCLDNNCTTTMQKQRYDQFMSAIKTKNIPITYVETLNDGYNFIFNYYKF